jgi:peptidoglycan/xylan/chitin deacetylase (PgdA/CDA1 family)
VADREPGLVREIVNAEHEVGCHSYWHRRLWRLTPEEFRADTRRALACLRNRERAGAVVYLHPWELDPDQPRLEGRWRSRLRHYLNLRSVEKRLTGLLAHTTFVPRHEFLRAHGAQRPLRSISPGAV